MPLFVMAHCMHHLVTALPVPMLPLIRDEFKLDYTQSGFVVSAFNLLYGIGQLPAGWLAGRIGSRALITVGITGVALAGLLIGLSRNYIMLLVFLGLMGLMGGGYHPSTPPLISATVEPKNLGRALGVHVIGGSISYFLAPLIAAGIAAYWGWRGPFLVLAIPTMIFGITFYFILGRMKSGKSEKAFVADSRVAPLPGHFRRLVSFIALSTSNGAITQSIIAFMPLFMVDHFGLSKQSAAAFIALIYSGGLWAGPLGGYFSDRWGKVPVMVTICLIYIPTIYLLYQMPNVVGFGALLVIFGVLMYIRMPVSESFIVSQTSSRNRTTVLGIYYFCSMEGGGVLTPVIGYLIDRFGFYTSFSIAAAALLAVTLVCLYFLRTPKASR